MVGAGKIKEENNVYEITAIVVYSQKISSSNVYNLDVYRDGKVIAQEYIAPADHPDPAFWPAFQWAESNLSEVPAEVPYPGKVVFSGEVAELPAEITAWLNVKNAPKRVTPENCPHGGIKGLKPGTEWSKNFLSTPLCPLCGVKLIVSREEWGTTIYIHPERRTLKCS